MGLPEGPYVHLIKSVVHWSSSDDGDAIQLQTIAEDGSQVVIRSAYKDAARLAQAIVQAACIAEQVQDRVPRQNIELVSPWIVTGMNSGASIDGKQVGLLFQTTEGVPVEVTMSPELARDAIERLSKELETLERALIPKLS